MLQWPFRSEVSDRGVEGVGLAARLVYCFIAVESQAALWVGWNSPGRHSVRAHEPADRGYDGDEKEARPVAFRV